MADKMYDVIWFDYIKIYLDEIICHHAKQTHHPSIMALVINVRIRIKIGHRFNISWDARFALATDALDNNPSLPTHTHDHFCYYADQDWSKVGKDHVHQISGTIRDVTQTLYNYEYLCCIRS